MAIARLPPGFRFHPTDVELILYYLKRKVLGKPLAVQAIAEVDIYKYAPSDLPDKSSMCTKDLEWYFFCARGNSPRTKRATETGYWKMTGRDRDICVKSQVVGMRKTLVFYIGRAPHGTRTNWVMHEYALKIKDWIHTGISQDSYFLCKVFEKSGVGPKNGEQHGAPFKEEEWEDELVDESAVSLLLFTHNFPSTTVNDGKVIVTEGSTRVLEKTCKSSFQPPCEPSDIKRKGVSLSEKLDMDSIFTLLGEENDSCQSETERNRMSKLFNRGRGINFPHPLDGDDIFGDLEDLNTRQNMDGICLLDLVTDNCAPLLEDADSRQYPLGDAASGQNIYGDEIVYLELNDLEGPMKYPIGGDGPNDIQYDNSGVESFGRILPTNSNMLVEDSLDMVSNDHFGFGVPENSLLTDSFSMPFVSSKAVYPTSTVGAFGCMLPRNPSVLADDLDVTSNDHIGFGTTKISSTMGHFPFVSSEIVHLTSGVESSRCMLPMDSGVLADNLDAISNDHISFGITANSVRMDGFSVPFVSSETIHHTSRVGSFGCELPLNSGVLEDDLDVDSNDHIGFGVAPNQFRTSSRGEQHRDNLRLQCLLGSIPVHLVSAAEYPSSIIAGEGSNGTSLSVNHGGFSLHVKAEVTVCCGCTKDALSGKLGVFPYLCCYGWKFSEEMLDKKAAAAAAPCSGLFNHVVVAVVWLCLIPFVVKLCFLLNDLHGGLAIEYPLNSRVTVVIKLHVLKLQKNFCRSFVDVQAAKQFMAVGI